MLNSIERAGALALVAALAASVATGRVQAAGAGSGLEAPSVVAQAEKPSGKGTVNAVDATARRINMTHGPIAALKWDGMTMNFDVAPGVDIGALKPGEKISFTLKRGDGGMYVVDSFRPDE